MILLNAALPWIWSQFCNHLIIIDGALVGVVLSAPVIMSFDHYISAPYISMGFKTMRKIHFVFFGFKPKIYQWPPHIYIEQYINLGCLALMFWSHNCLESRIVPR